MKRYLVVDDDELSCKILADYMSEFALCDMVTDGMAAFELFEKAIIAGNPYDLICSDVLMPGISGHEMVQRIRSREESLPIAGYIRTKIFMISASSATKDISQAILENNCDDYIVKPFQREALKDMLQRHGLIEYINEP